MPIRCRSSTSPTRAATPPVMFSLRCFRHLRISIGMQTATPPEQAAPPAARGEPAISGTPIPLAVAGTFSTSTASHPGSLPGRRSRKQQWQRQRHHHGERCPGRQQPHLPALWCFHPLRRQLQPPRHDHPRPTANAGPGGITVNEFAYGSTVQGKLSISAPVSLNKPQTWTNNKVDTDFRQQTAGTRLHGCERWPCQWPDPQPCPHHRWQGRDFPVWPTRRPPSPGRVASPKMAPAP